MRLYELPGNLDSYIKPPVRLCKALQQHQCTCAARPATMIGIYALDISQDGAARYP